MKLKTLQIISFIVINVFLNLSGYCMSVKPSLLNPDELLKFGDYPIVQNTFNKAEKIDFTSDLEARKYRTILSSGLKKGPNYAHYLIVVEQGCGTNCQVQWIVDSRNGRVLKKFDTTLGAEYNTSSNLLILNPPAAIINDEIKKLKAKGELPHFLDCINTSFIVWDGSNFKEVKKVSTKEYIN